MPHTKQGREKRKKKIQAQGHFFFSIKKDPIQKYAPLTLKI